MKSLLDKYLSWFPPYRMAMGGYWYYSYVRERRYAPKEFCSCGTEVVIAPGVLIECPEKMKIGHGVRIGANCHIDATGGFQIGNCSGLGMDCTVLTLDHQPGEKHIPFDDTRIIRPVVIEDCVWVGRQVCILPGVTIGEGAIVGLGAVVRQDVPPCAMVVGNPARVVGYRDKDHYYSLKKNGATRPVSSHCSRLRIPPEMREKYGGLLRDIGYDVNAVEFSADSVERERQKSVFR
jgi:acetyltransferase-like isoleucine patch superfamily enzyme